MKRHAFTLIELLVAAAIIALLMAILLPQLQRVRSLARKVICGNNLHQIDGAFKGLQGTGQAGGRSYCPPVGWPGVPMTVIANRKIYICPESEVEAHDVSEYIVYNGYVGVDVPFEDQSDVPGGQGLCRLIEDTSEHSIWGFEGGIARDLWNGGPGYLTDGSVDFVIETSKMPPLLGTNLTMSWQGQYEGLSLMLRGKPVKGWEDFRYVERGATFEMDGGSTNYGINALVGGVQIAPDTIVLLDYVERVANRGGSEDMTDELRRSARHLGRINVLDASGSVRTSGPTQLDPAVRPAPWSP